MSMIPTYRFPPADSIAPPSKSQYGIASQLRAPPTGIPKYNSLAASEGRNSPSPISFLRKPTERKGSLRKPPPSFRKAEGKPNLGAAIDLNRGISNGSREGNSATGMTSDHSGEEGRGKRSAQWEEKGSGAGAVLAHGVTNPTKFISPWTTPTSHSRIPSSVTEASPRTASSATTPTSSTSTVPGISPGLDVQLGQQKGSYYASIGSSVLSSSARTSTELEEEDFDPTVIRTASVSVARRESFVEGVTPPVRSRLVPLPATPTQAQVQRSSQFHRPTTSTSSVTPPGLYRGSSRRTPTHSPSITSSFGFERNSPLVRPLMPSPISSPIDEECGPKGESPTSFSRGMNTSYNLPSPTRQMQQPKSRPPLSPAPSFALPSRPHSALLPSPPASTTTQSFFPQKTTTNSTRLPMRTMSIGSRTAHLSSRRGYGWRVRLCDELERLNPGMFLSIQEIESIISIEEIPFTSKRPSFDGSILSATTSTKTGFFSKIKRSFSSADDSDHLPDHSLGQTRSAAPYTVFGVPLATSTTYASCEAIIDGSRQSLPICVFATGEEIYRRGMRTPGLMKLAGEGSRVGRLMEIYNAGPDYGDSFDLSLESIHVVTSLLIRFLRDLPEPILDHRLWRLYITCSLDSPRPLNSRIGSARTLLRLLPSANFSLLVYLLAFLSQLSLVEPSRLTVEQIAVIFGPAVFSARVNSGSNVILVGGMVFGTIEEMGQTRVTVKKAQDALLWLLNHWTEVSKDLLESNFRPEQVDRSSGVKPLPHVRYQPFAINQNQQPPSIAENKSFRRRSSLPISSFDSPSLASIQERRKSSLPRIEDTSQIPLAPVSENRRPQSAFVQHTDSRASIDPSPKTVADPWSSEDRRREELGLIPRGSRSEGMGTNMGREERRDESSLDSDGMISSTRSWGSTAPSSVEPSKDQYLSAGGMQERSVLDDLLELDDSSTYSASAGGGNSESFHDQSHDQINYASYQTSPFSDSIELLHRDSIMSHPDLTSFTPQTNPNPRQSAEIKRLWTDLEQSEKMREMAVGEVERLRMIAKDAESVFAREQRRVEMELRNEVEILSRQLQSIRGILS